MSADHKQSQFTRKAHSRNEGDSSSAHSLVINLASSFTILSAQSSCVWCVLKPKKERIVTDRTFVTYRSPTSPIPDVSAPETSGMCSVSFRDSRAAVTAVLGCRLHLLTPANSYWLARSCGVRRLQLKTSRESFLAFLSARGSKYYIPLSNLTAGSDPRGPCPRAGRRATNRRSPPGDAGTATRAEAGRRRTAVRTKRWPLGLQGL